MDREHRKRSSAIAPRHAIPILARVCVLLQQFVANEAFMVCSGSFSRGNSLSFRSGKKVPRPRSSRIPHSCPKGRVRVRNDGWRAFETGGGKGRRKRSRAPVGELLAETEIVSRPADKQDSKEMEKKTEEVAPADEGFQWRRQWYPVVVMRDLEAMDPRKPYSFKLLGEALVIWKQPDGGWKCFADRCPHRWAPLSEGRVDQETGRLQCIYHGWEFAGDGKCENIPQADPAVSESAQKSRRACATVIPVKIAQGKLWLWPDASAEGVKESSLVSPATVPELDSGGFGGDWYARDLPYGYDTLVENLVDAAHVPFAHHGVIGTRALGTPMGITMAKGEETDQDEFKTQNTGFAGSKNMVVAFKAPSLIYYRTDYSDLLPVILQRLPAPFKLMAWVFMKLKLDKRMAMKPEDRKEPSDSMLSYFVGYAVPISPGKCRIFTRTCRNFFLQHPVIPRRWRNSLAEEHLGQHLVTDGDTTALHMQERFLVEAGKTGSSEQKNTERTFYMPTDADAPVRAFRKWYNSRGAGSPSWATGVDPLDLGPVLPRNQILDRMDAHTKDCSACGKAFRVSGKLKRVAVGAALLLLGGAAASPRGPLALCMAVAAMTSSGFAYAMAQRQQRFVFVDYVHASRDG